MRLYRRAFFIALLLFPVCVATSTGATAHTFHTSLMNMEYNRQEQSVEISLQVFSHDLEAVLSLRSSKSVHLDQTPAAEQLTFAYLQDVLNLKNGAGETKKFAWVGMEMKADRVWLYIEAKMPEGLRGAQFRNRIFFELFNDQLNLVHLKDGEQKKDLDFKPGDNFKPLFPTYQSSSTSQRNNSATLHA